MSQVKSVIGAFIAKVVGFLIFLVLLALANIFSVYIQSVIFHDIVNFLNANFWLILSFSIVLLIGELFAILYFPLNIPAPLFYAVGAFLVVKFIINIFQFLIEYQGIPLNLPYNTLYLIISFMVFVIVIVVGYIHIFRDAIRPKKNKINIHKELKYLKRKKKIEKERKK